MKANELNSKQVIRNFQLYLLSDIELEEPFRSIYNDLINKFKNLNKYECENGNIHFGKSKSDLYILNYSGQILLDYNNVWESFEHNYKYNLSYETIQGITTWYLNNEKGLSGVSEIYFVLSELVLVGNNLIKKGTTNWYQNI